MWSPCPELRLCAWLYLDVLVWVYVAITAWLIAVAFVEKGALHNSTFLLCSFVYVKVDNLWLAIFAFAVRDFWVSFFSLEVLGVLEVSWKVALIKIKLAPSTCSILHSVNLILVPALVGHDRRILASASSKAAYTWLNWHFIVSEDASWCLLRTVILEWWLPLRIKILKHHGILCFTKNFPMAHFDICRSICFV